MSARHHPARRPAAPAVAALALLLLAACGGSDPAAAAPVTLVSSGCDVPLAGQCAVLTTTQATWEAFGGAAAWARQCASGAEGSPGTVVTGCPTAGRVGHCTVGYATGNASATITYGYYAPAYGLERAAQACAALQGAFVEG